VRSVIGALSWVCAAMGCVAGAPVCDGACVIEGERSCVAARRRVGRGRGWLVVVGVVVVLVFGAVPAFAVPFHPYVGQNAGLGSPAGGLSWVCATAVDAHGVVYVGDFGNNVVDVFDSSGGYLAQISDPAVSGPCGLAVDSSGNVFVRNLNFGNVVEFNPSVFPVTNATSYTLDGRLGESSPGANDGNGVLDANSASGVAVAASNDHVFVAETSQVQEFDSAGAAVGAPFGSGSIAQASGLAVDAGGTVYVSDIGQGRVELFSGGVLSSSFNAADSPAGGFAPSGLAIDSADGHVLVVDVANGVVDEFDAAGAYQERITAVQTPQGFFSLTDPAGVAVDRSGGPNDGDVYLGDDFNNVVDQFGPTAISTPPTAVVDVPGAVSADGAHLSGTVNPQGFDTRWHFEFSTDEASWQPVSGPQDAGSGTGDVAVSDTLTGLEPHKQYFVRLVADNGIDPAVASTDQAFTTLAIAPDVATGTNAPDGTGGVIVRGFINPRNSQITDCRFDYGPTTSYGQSTACQQDPGAVNQSTVITVDLHGLTPGAVYHFRITATNQAGTTHSEDSVFVVPATATTPDCPNQQFRTGPASRLPDCRAWEDVSPADKNSGDIVGDSSFVNAAPDTPGLPAAVTFAALTGFQDVHGTGVATQYISQRTTQPDTSGWTTHALTPVEDALSLPATARGLPPLYQGDLSSDLTRGVLKEWTSHPGNPDVAKVENLYLRTDLRTPGPGAYQLLTTCPLCTTTNTPLPPLRSGNQAPIFAGASGDYSHVVFESKLNLTANATGGNYKLYEASNGSLRMLSVPGNPGCPSAQPCSAAGIGAVTFLTPHTISSDGSRVLFTAPINNGSDTPTDHVTGASASKIYEFDDHGTADPSDDTTVEVNASELTDCAGDPTCGGDGVPDPAPATPLPANYEDASADGSRVFFTTQERLTDDAPTDGQQHLYMWSLTPDGQGHHLTVLDVNANSIEAPAVRGVLGVSRDGHFVYFVENGQLLSNPSLPLFQHSIYLWHDDGGAPRLEFVGYFGTPLNADNNLNPHATSRPKVARVTPDGRHLLFEATDGTGFTGEGPVPCVTGVDVPGVTNSNGGSGGACSQVFVYSADSRQLVCVSCVGGVPASRNVFVTNSGGFHTGAGNAFSTTHLDRAISDDGGRVFFSTSAGLVSQDVNGKVDVYEYDVASGLLRLLSSGSDEASSWFMEASPSGGDVFFITRERLSGWDVDNNYDLYDARVGGGVADPAPSPVPCSGEGCQGQAVAPPSGLAPGSQSLLSAGNVRSAPKRKAGRCRRGFVRRRVRGRVRCVRRRVHRPRRVAHTSGVRKGR